MAMSIVQDGSGFSFLAPPVYQYICGVDIPRIAIADEDVPDYDVRKIIEEVHEHTRFRVRGCYLIGPFACTWSIVHADQQSWGCTGITTRLSASCGHHHGCWLHTACDISSAGWQGASDPDFETALRLAAVKGSLGPAHYRSFMPGCSELHQGEPRNVWALFHCCYKQAKLTSCKCI